MIESGEIKLPKMAARGKVLTEDEFAQITGLRPRPRQKSFVDNSMTADQLREAFRSGQVGVHRGRLVTRPSGKFENFHRNILTRPVDRQSHDIVTIGRGSLTLPLPPSENKLWVHAQDRETGAYRRFLSSEARDYRKRIQSTLERLVLPPASILRPVWHFHYRWFGKNGKLRRWDETNYIKFLQDCLADAAGIDDCLFKQSDTYSTDAKDGPGYVTVSFEEIGETP